MFLVAGWGLPESGGGISLREAAAKFDWAGMLVMAATVSVELVGVNRASVVGWASPQVLAPLAASVPLACLFLSLEARRERRGLECVIRPSLFSPDTTLAVMSSFTRFVAYIGLFTAVPLFLRDFYHMDADHAAALVSVRPFMYGIDLAVTFCGTEAPGNSGSGGEGARGQGTGGYFTASVFFLCIFLVALALVLAIAVRTWGTWG